MTVSDTELKEQYTGNGSSRTFGFSHPFIATSDLLVYEENDGDVVLRVEGTDYDVTGTPVNGRYPNGGDVVFKIGHAPASGVLVTITRNTPITQEVDYLSNDNFPAETHEGALDKLTLQIQEIQGKIDRAVKLPVTTTLTSLEMEEGEENKLIGWNAAGDALENKDILDIETILLPSLVGNASKLLRSSSGETGLEFAGLSDLADQAYAVDVGSTDAYAVNLTPAPTSYFAGMRVCFKANTVNTGTCSLNVNGLGAKTISKSKLVSLEDGDIQAGQVVEVIYDGSWFQMLSPTYRPLSSYSLMGVTNLTGSGTYVKPTSCTRLFVECIGGGGGGGGPTNNATIGGGGAAGGYSAAFIAAPSSTYSYAVGAAGAAGSGGGGGTGGNTTFGSSFLVANGGAGGAQNGAAFAAGGTASGGDINVVGQYGGGGGADATSANGAGASSRFGTGGPHGLPGSGGQIAIGFGAGGGGGHRDTTTNRDGGAGVAGTIRVWEFG